MKQEAKVELFTEYESVERLFSSLKGILSRSDKYLSDRITKSDVEVWDEFPCRRYVIKKDNLAEYLYEAYGKILEMEMRLKKLEKAEKLVKLLGDIHKDFAETQVIEKDIESLEGRLEKVENRVYPRAPWD